MNSLDIRTNWSKSIKSDVNQGKVEKRRQIELIEMAKRYKAENDCTFEEARKVMGL